MSREYGIQIKIGDKETTVYLSPLTYADWLYYGDPENLYTPSVYRYLILKYITRVTQDDTVMNASEFISLITGDNDLVFKTVLDFMIDKSGYGDVSYFEDKIAKYTTRVLKRDGIYDIFIALHTDPGTYGLLLESDIETRAHFISVLQHTTGIDIRERYDDHVEYGVPLDLTTPGVEYEKQATAYLNTNDKEAARKRIENHNKKHINQRNMVKNQESGQPPEPGPNDVTREYLAGTEFKDTTEALHHALDTDQRNPKQVFNWHSDEADLSRNDLDEDSKIITTDRPTPAGG